jgi:1-acyl-sn-glycerol-3-phosphate acyltransferase
MTGRAWWYRLLQAAVRAVLKAACRLEVKGVENVPDHGPFLLVCNHLSMMDAPVIGATFPHRSVAFAARKWEQKPVVGWLLRVLGEAIFVYRGEVDRHALRQALAVLQEGKILTVATEGTRSDTGALQEGKEGAAYLAFRAKVPLVPVVAYGQEKVLRNLRHGRRVPVHVVYGPPFNIPSTSGRLNRDQIQQFTRDIMLRLAGLLPEEYRGVYAEAYREQIST